MASPRQRLLVVPERVLDRRLLSPRGSWVVHVGKNRLRGADRRDRLENPRVAGLSGAVLSEQHSKPGVELDWLFATEGIYTADVSKTLEHQRRFSSNRVAFDLQRRNQLGRSSESPFSAKYCVVARSTTSVGAGERVSTISQPEALPTNPADSPPTEEFTSRLGRRYFCLSGRTCHAGIISCCRRARKANSSNFLARCVFAPPLFTNQKAPPQQRRLLSILLWTGVMVALGGASSNKTVLSTWEQLLEISARLAVSATPAAADAEAIAKPRMRRPGWVWRELIQFARKRQATRNPKLARPPHWQRRCWPKTDQQVKRAVEANSEATPTKTLCGTRC